MSTSDALTRVLDAVAKERVRQDRKWGVQNHPDGTGPVVPHLYDLPTDIDDDTAVRFTYADDFENWARAACEHRFAAGEGTFADILLEEVAEVLATADPTHLRVELIQVAAVAVAWVEKLDRERQAE